MTVGESSALMRFVSAADHDRAVRLDLNSAPNGAVPPIKTLAEGTELGPPPLERAVVAPADRDGDTVVSSRYGNRTLTVNLRVYGDAEMFGSAMSALTRELDRAVNWLEFKPPGAADPVFFRTFRADISRLDLSNAGRGNDKWDIEVPVLAEPFAYGATVDDTVLALSNNPATGQVLSLPPIKGDVAAPLLVELASATSSGATTLLSAHTSPGAPAAILLQAETATLGADTTVQANDTAMSGSGSNYVRTTFATATSLQQRVSWPNLIAGFGEYKVLVRVRKSSAAAVYDLRRRLVTYGGDVFAGPTRRYVATSFATDVTWIDLGQVTFPAGHIRPGETSGDVGELLIDEGRVSGSGSVDIDCVKLVPTRLPDAPAVNTSLTWRSAPTLSGVVLGFDAAADQVYTYRTAGDVGVEQISRGGSLPMVHPGHDNHLVIMRSVGQRPYGGSGFIRPDVLSWTTDVTWSYRPRYLYVSAPA